MDNVKLFCFIKFGKKQHMENLLKQGQLHFSPLENFSESDEKERGDSFEGALQIINDQFTEITCDHPELGKHIFKVDSNSLGRIVQYSTAPFCSYSILSVTGASFSDGDTYKLNSSLATFGDHAVLIKEPIEFINRIKAKLISEQVEFGCKLIQYKDYNLRGEIKTDFFHKHISYAHQAEYRFLIKHKEAIDFNIGSIEEFSSISSALDMTKMIFNAKRNNSS